MVGEVEVVQSYDAPCVRMVRPGTIIPTTSGVIASKWQVTIPEEIRKEVPSVAIGQRLRWEVVDGVLTAIPVQGITALAGCLRTDDMPVVSRGEEKAAIERAKTEHYRRKHAKR